MIESDLFLAEDSGECLNLEMFIIRYIILVVSAGKISVRAPAPPQRGQRSD